MTLTATVTSGATGTVNFEVGGVSISGCAAVSVSAGSAQCVTTALATGTDSLQALYSGNSTYASSQSAAANYVVAPDTQSALTITTTSTTAAPSPGNTVTLATTGGSTGGAVTYVVSGTGNTATCSVVGAVLTYTAAGSCTVTATMAGNTNYSAVSSSATTFTVNLATSTTSLGESPTSSTYGGSVTLTATVTSGATGTVNFEVGGVSISGCAAVSVSAGSAQCVTTALATGTDSLQALYSGNSTYASSQSAAANYQVARASQAPLVVATTSGTIGIDLTLATTGGSGTGAVTYVVTSGTATCTQPSPGVVHASGAGTCLVVATRAGDTNYTSVNSTSTTVTFSENQTITFTSSAPTSVSVLGIYTPTATSSANLAVTITIDAASSSVCSLTAGQVTFLAPGTCVIDANQAGQGNILAASQVQQSITVLAASHHSTPSAPIDVAAAPGGGGVIVTWSPPSSSGTSPITSYVVTVAPGGASCTSATTSCQLTGLTVGATYTISVVAVNLSGDSPAGTATFAFVVGVPTAPLDVMVTANGGDVAVTWTAPTSDGGSTILRYEVTASGTGVHCTSTGGTSCTLEGLRDGESYVVSVVAVNAVGPSTPGVSSPMLMLASPVVEADSGTVTISWRAPTNGSGRTVVGYEVTLEPGGQRCTTTGATRCSITGAPVANEYTATVTALDAAGAALGSATGRTSTRAVAIAHFAFNSYALTSSDRRALSRLAATVVASGWRALSFFGFTDDRGGVAYNRVLSQERASAVGRYLSAQLARRGYHGLSIRVVGAGISRADASLAQNRKVTVRL